MTKKFSNKYTPGPWIVLETDEFGGTTITNGKSLQAERTAQAFSLGNAYLIAAAPEMLEALKDILVVIPRYDLKDQTECYIQALDAVLKAIAKAEGGAK